MMNKTQEEALSCINLKSFKEEVKVTMLSIFTPVLLRRRQSLSFLRGFQLIMDRSSIIYNVQG